ncbi:hypothetical protein OHA57_11150 [Streptomyces anulatus]|uniref:hypothetical protein n=1 Tax=Streptomyces TaxID=1883 RepID=UPI00093983D3|nr:MULTISPECIES: hypothetical protein [Streptomyces]OKI80709.1 hypothetical protein AMK12_14555 [Streptomyces sp. TSRI0395]WSC66358.1 hypothetical protein OHA57_11150 [Streptomyces anulatus]WSR80778.1 hypothetical protein OG274_10595 [Streptomyces anulatus]GGY23231.1 hypothetical protein GCM10010342_07470 [Streptomyces anulatus]
MLQCTAVTLLPPDAVLRFLAPGADDTDDPEPYVLCELGEHDGPHTEHAAQAPHSWDVEDPLGDLIAERLVPDDSPEGGPYP